jgi:glutamate carboxypeptidase
VSRLVSRLRERTGELVDAVGVLVAVESPSEDRPGLWRCADAVAELGTGLLGTEPERIALDARPLLRWRFGQPRVLLLAHLDTVWPLGTIERWPFRVTDGRATGPGAFDMKAGLVLGMFGLAMLDDLDGVCLMVTSDEEIGSPSSHDLIVQQAEGLDAALVLEPGLERALKVGRKGVAQYRLVVGGRAAHAGLEPERGANALLELADLLLAAEHLADPERGTTITPTICAAGTAVNVVPATAAATVDVRAATVAEQERVDQAIRALRTERPGTRLVVEGGPHRPPMEQSASATLYPRAARIAADLGLPALGQAVVGGGSDGNLTAAAGTPTLDGLGAVGGNAHAEGEFVLIEPLPERAALVSALVGDLLGDRRQRRST